MTNLPERFGTALPTNPQDLMKFLENKRFSRGSQQTLPSTHSIMNQSRLGDMMGELISERLRKQEAQRELMEGKMMELEYYVYSQEGQLRLIRLQERLKMETEDSLSVQLKDISRSHDQQALRDRIRKEVDQRKAQEIAERDARRKAAEERRAAAVARIRRQAELEEERKREAELALVRIAEDKARKEQWEINRLLADQARIVMEDQLSGLIEQELRERVERQAWQRREQQRLKEWELEQQKKDLLEAEQRRLRMAELEEKKKKLEQLRQLQSNRASQGNRDQLQAMKVESDRLNKQMRIQNRAKFVTKRIQAASTGNNNVEGESKVASRRQSREWTILPVVNETMGVKDAMLARALSIRNFDGDIFNTNEKKDVVKSNENVATESGQAAQEVMQQFAQSLQGMTSEKELRDLLQFLMKEKRAAKLEQRQRASHQLKGQKGLHEQLIELNRKSDLVQKRIDELLAAATAAVMSSSQATDEASSLEVETQAAVSSLSSSSAKYTTANAMPESSSPSDPESDKLRRAERLLQEIQQALSQLPELESPISLPAVKLEEQFVAQLTKFSLEILVLQKEIDPSADPLGFLQQLTQANDRLKKVISKLEAISTTVHTVPHPLSKQSSLSGRPTSGSSARKQSFGVVENRKNDALLSEMVARSSRPSSGISRHSSIPKAIAECSSISPRTSVVTTMAASTSEPVISTSDCRAFMPETVEVTEVADLNKDDVDGAEINQFDPSTLPGWQECIYTTMFTAAHHAAYFGLIDVLGFLCQCFDCFIMDRKGRTPLFYAALGNRLDCAAALVELDPQWLDVGDEKGDTPLHAASIANSVQVLAFLLSCEANPDTANYQGLTPSHLARSKDCLEVLHRAGAQLYCVDNHSRIPLWYACKDGRVDCVEYLCQATPAEFLLWKDEDGETCLHMAASQGHHEVVEVLCQHLPQVEDMYALNKKQHTAAHVAANAKVIQSLYENGANVWMKDVKDHTPLFFASFFGRTDSVALFINLALSKALEEKNARSPRGNNGGNDGCPELITVKDQQGDTALHVACLTGHFPCVSLLAYYLRDEKNRQQLRPSDLANKAGHTAISQFVSYIETQRVQGRSSKEIFGHDFATFSSFVSYYGSRWMKAYDSNFDSCYYVDRISNESQWDRPPTFDMINKDEQRFDQAKTLLQQFYQKYNPDKAKDISHILIVYYNRYTELFITLANKYNVQDLSMFAGINLD